MTTMDARLKTRLLNAAAMARDALAPYDYASRVMYNAIHGDQIFYRHEGEDLVIVWGGADLARIDAETLRAMAEDDELEVAFADMPAVPDSPAALIDGDGGVS